MVFPWIYIGILIFPYINRYYQYIYYPFPSRASVINKIAVNTSYINTLSLCPIRIRLAAGFNDRGSGANFFFWFMHSITLTLHGKHNHTYRASSYLIAVILLQYFTIQALSMHSYLPVTGKHCLESGGLILRYIHMLG